MLVLSWELGSEISNKYSKRWIDSSHAYNFGYLYAPILILKLYPHYSFSKKVLILLILNNTHDIVDFDSPWIYDIHEAYIKYDSNTNPTILSRRLCVFFACFLCIFLSYFFVNAATTRTVNVDEWFESLESYISIINIFLKLWI